MTSVRESLSRGEKAGILMFMLGTIPVLGTSVSTTLVLMNEHGAPGQPAPVVGDVLAGTLIFTTAGALTFALAPLDWRAMLDKLRTVFSR